jgi:hypothetical protein
MLNDILNAMVDMYYHRQASTTTYCGFGTVIDREIETYLDNGGSFPLLRKVDELAHFRAVELHYQENVPSWR